MADMGFDGGRAEHKPSGDLRVAQPLDHQGKHNPLALRQIVAWRGRLVSSMDQRLGCLWRQGGPTTDYWVNAMDGQPFFAVTQAADPGLLQTLAQHIVPQLLEEVPGQPSVEALEVNRYRARFTMNFDRAGYSPEFFADRWKQRIAVITYNKFPTWPVGGRGV